MSEQSQETEAGDFSLGWESAKGIIGKFVQAGLGFLGTVIFARILGPTSFGGYYFLLSLILLADRPVKGFGSAVKKRFSEAGAPRSEILGVVVVVSVGVSLAAIPVLVLVGDSLARETNVENAAFVAFALLFSLAFFYPGQQLLAARGLIAKQVWNDTLRSVLTFGLQLVFVLGGLGAAGMGYGLAGGTLLTIPLVIYFVRTRPTLPSRETLHSIWVYARYSVPETFVGKAYREYDTLLLGLLLTTSAVGQYQVAFKLTVPATFIMSVTGSGLMSKVSNLHSRNQPIAKDINNVLAYNSVLAVPILFGVLALSQPLIITIYGGNYKAAGPLLIGLGLYRLIDTQSTVYNRVLGAIDRPDISFRISLITLIFNVLAGLALVLAIGMLGAVVATVLAELMILVLGYRAVRQQAIAVSPIPRPLLEQISGGVIMFVTVVAVHRVVPVHSWIDLALLVGLGAIVYGSSLLAVSGHFRDTLHSIYYDAVA